MADASVVTGVRSLVPLCRDGLEMLRAVFGHSEALQRACDRIQLQIYRFDEWTAIWSFQGEPMATFEDYAATHPFDAEAILVQLGFMAKLMFDVNQLEKLYNLETESEPNVKGISTFGLTSRSVQTSFLHECRSKIPLIQPGRFISSKPGPGWGRLIQQLREYNDQLRTYGLPEELVKLKKSQFEMLFKVPFDRLQGIVDASSHHARACRKASQDSSFYTEFANAAQFRRAIHAEKDPARLRRFTMRDFKLDKKYKLPGSDDTSTMALLFDYPYKTERRVVLIEWMYTQNEQDRENALSNASILASPMPEPVLIPTCHGIVEDNQKKPPRIGLVLSPPEHISCNLPTNMAQGAISQKRMPVSLRDLLTYCSYPMDLSLRFELSKRLVDSVHMMHCVGFAHEHIRPTSILFFPANVSKAIQLSLAPSKWNIDPVSPFIVGFSKAGVDDVPNILAAFESYDPFKDIEASEPQKPRSNDVDWYDHPDKRKYPAIPYSRHHDIYSLGCVLLEIGMWQSLNVVADVNTKDPKDLQKQLIGTCETRLKGFAGAKFAGVVRSCLSLPASHKTDGTTETSELLIDLASTLDSCAA